MTERYQPGERVRVYYGGIPIQGEYWPEPSWQEADIVKDNNSIIYATPIGEGTRGFSRAYVRPMAAGYD